MREESDKKGKDIDKKSKTNSAKTGKIPKNKKEHMEKNPDFTGYSADIKKNIRRIFWLCFVLFGILSAYICKVIIIDGDEIASNSYNPRLEIQEEIKRGDIIDFKGNLLATTVLTSEGALVRSYPMGREFSHIVGYVGNGKGGIESKFNFHLEAINKEIIQQFRKVLTDEPVEGNSLVTTIDADIQKFAYEQINGQRGSVVVIEPKTGKILAMVSYPDFDPNSIEEEWESLITDEENSPLLNRATQGLYPPGSVFKLLTSAASHEYLPDNETFTYDCQGIEYFGVNRIRCFDSKAHGHEDIVGAFAESCNTFFSTIGLKIGGENFKNLAEKNYFNRPYPFELEYNMSSFELNGSSLDNEIIQTSIGQGKTLVTPIHMAMITSTVANEGVMMKPYVVDHILTSNGKTKDKRLPEVMDQVYSFEEAEFIEKMMIEAVESGTGQAASINGINVAGKTGTAENSSGDDHGWFIAFAPAENPEVVVSVILENSGGSRKSIKIAKNIMEYVINDI